MVATPQGSLARHFYGIRRRVGNLRPGLVEASQGGIGSPVDELLRYCCQYDPGTGKYSVVISRVLKVAAVVTIISLRRKRAIARCFASPPSRKLRDPQVEALSLPLFVIFSVRARRRRSHLSVSRATFALLRRKHSSRVPVRRLDQPSDLVIPIVVGNTGQEHRIRLRPGV
jgi:hypothetical protein